MVAVKANKEYNVTEADKQYYLEQGYDIYENGKIIEYSPKKMIKYNEHLEKVKELTAKVDELSKVNTELTAKVKEFEKAQKSGEKNK